MKRKMLAAVFALSAALAIGQEKSILQFNYGLELGWLPLNTWWLHATGYTGEGKDFYVTLDAEIVLLKIIFVGGNVRTFMSLKNDQINFSPSEVWYNFRAGLRFGGLEIGFRHSCLHPIIPYIYLSGIGDINAEGGYEEVYISFKGSVTLF